MDKLFLRFFIFLFCFIITESCENQKSEQNSVGIVTTPSDSNNISLQFSFEINKEIYLKTNYGQPPQIAIWIESTDSSIIKTVWVTHRTAKQDWKGKIECPVSLPFWEYKTLGKRQDQVIDAVSKATPKEGLITATVSVPLNSQWKYYIEVNVSADYNNKFSYWSKDGLPDSEANGQPSLIYSGHILADGKNFSTPVLVGRTNQRYAIKEMSKDLSGVTSAKQLLKKLIVTSETKI